MWLRKEECAQNALDLQNPSESAYVCPEDKHGTEATGGEMLVQMQTSIGALSEV